MEEDNQTMPFFSKMQQTMDSLVSSSSTVSVRVNIGTGQSVDLGFEGNWALCSILWGLLINQAPKMDLSLAQI